MSELATDSFFPEKGLKEKTMKTLLWLGIGSMVMIFAGLTSAYVVRKGAGNWLEFQLPQLFYISTAVILTSSITMNWALSAIKLNQLKNLKIALILTLTLGIVFVICQFQAWSALIDNHIFFTGKESNASGSFLYVLSGLHIAHLLGGLIALLVGIFKSFGEKYSSQNYLGIKLIAIYWHFLDALWVYLFLFLYFIH